MTSDWPLASLEWVPDDVFKHVVDHLDYRALVRLRLVSRRLDARVRDVGAPVYLASRPLSFTTLYPHASQWAPLDLLALHGRIEHSLRTHALHAVQVGVQWPQRAIPALALSEDALLLGVGPDLLLHPLIPRGRGPRVIDSACVFPVAARAGTASDIVGVHRLSGGSVAVAQFDGTVQRLELGPRGARSTAHYMHPRARGASSPANIHVMAGEGDTILVASSAAARVFRTRAPWETPDQTELGVRAWSAALSPRHAFLGVSGGIRTYARTPSGLHLETTLHGLQPEHSAAYGLALAPERSAHGPHTLLSAWYDGVARLHDLRVGGGPVLEMTDPWSDSALYSAAFVGQWSAAAGGAQHGTVSVWDVRSPSAGWSLFSPGGRGSPVYSLAGEGGRVWGVTEQRAFVLAFDGAGDDPDGIVLPPARPPPPRKGVKEVPGGYTRRGGRFSWTVHYGRRAEREVTMGYRHGDRGMGLFETEQPKYGVA